MKSKAFVWYTHVVFEFFLRYVFELFLRYVLLVRSLTSFHYKNIFH